MGDLLNKSKVESAEISAHQIERLHGVCHRLAQASGTSVPPIHSIDDLVSRLEVLAHHCGDRISKRHHDEHELRRVRHELENVEQLKSRFIRNVSHELRTPLASIEGFARALLKAYRIDGKHVSDPHVEPISPEARQQFLSIISQEAQRLGKLIEDVLDLSDLESERTTLEPTEFTARELYDELMILFDDRSNPNMSGERIAVSNISIRLNPMPDGPSIYADRSAVIEILRQLLVNAQKFSGSKPVVLGAEFVSISPTESPTSPESGSYNSVSTAARLYVKDYGVGIPKDELDQIFDKFYRVEKATPAPGTGLGLSIVRALVTRNQGQVWADSELGVGTTFYVMLPTQPAGT